MSLLLNGSNLPYETYAFSLDDQSKVGEARRFALQCCARYDFGEVTQGRVSIIVNELGTNLIKYSSQGEILFRIIKNDQVYGIEILSVDKGPGIQNIGEALTDGFTTGSSPGTGLGAVKRQADEFDIYSRVGDGTLIVAIVHARDLSKAKPRYRVGAVNLPMKGETLSGDGWCVRQDANQITAIVTDGLGHGPLAHAAATEALEEFNRNTNFALLDAFTAIHNRLRGTRGAALFLAEWRDKKIEYAAVGNIRAIVQTSLSIRSLLSQNGTAGLKIPRVRVSSHDIGEENLFIIHSDGITSRWDFTKNPGLVNCHPSIIAALIYRDFSRGNDDLTIVVIGRNKNAP